MKILHFECPIDLVGRIARKEEFTCNILVHQFNFFQVLLNLLSCFLLIQLNSHLVFFVYCGVVGRADYHYFDHLFLINYYKGNNNFAMYTSLKEIPPLLPTLSCLLLLSIVEA